jgi:hypothetical protein
MLEYYTGREHVCLAITAGFMVKVFNRNPYRTQIVFQGVVSAGSFGIVLAHSEGDLAGVHRLFVLRAPYSAPVAVGTVAYTDPIILSYPTHGPMVGEEWWCVSDGGLADELDATGYLYTD